MNALNSPPKVHTFRLSDGVTVSYKIQPLGDIARTATNADARTITDLLVEEIDTFLTEYHPKTPVKPTHDEDYTPPFTCNICGKTFDDVENFASHQVSHHLTGFDWSVYLNPQRSAEVLDRHLRWEHPEMEKLYTTPSAPPRKRLRGCTNPDFPLKTRIMPLKLSKLKLQGKSVWRILPTSRWTI